MKGKAMSSITQMASILSTLPDPKGACEHLVAQCAHRSWRTTDPLERIGRMCSEVAQCENQARGKRAGSERALAGSTRVTIVRDYAEACKAGELPQAAWAAVLVKAEVPADGAGGRPEGTRSDAADAFRAMLAGGE